MTLLVDWMAKHIDEHLRMTFLDLIVKVNKDKILPATLAISTPSICINGIQSLIDIIKKMRLMFGSNFSENEKEFMKKQINKMIDEMNEQEK